MLTTWAFIRLGFTAGALAPGFWPDFLMPEITGLMIFAIFVFGTTPLTFLLTLAFLPARRLIHGARPRLPRHFLVCLVAMGAQFFGFLYLSYNPRIIESLHEYTTSLLLAAFAYVLLTWALFTLLKLISPARPALPLSKTFD